MYRFLPILLILYSCTGLENRDSLFVKVSPNRSGIDFQNTLRETEAFNVLKYGYFYNGGGVAVGDLNGDGLADIYLTGNLVASHLYLNQGGMKFKEVAEEAGVMAAGVWNTGTSMADINGDGLLDIYVCRSAAANPDLRRNVLFINKGNNENGVPQFEDEALQFGIDDPAYSTQASFFDYDRDGDLDMYLLNHSVQDFAGFNRNLAQQKYQRNPYYGDKLYRNEGGRFLDVTTTAGILSNVLGFGLGIGVSDLNNDGWPDIYVSNDYNEQDYLYLNQQDGTFKESLSTMLNHTSLFSMGSDIADINNDGHPEIYTLDMLPADPYRLKMSGGADNYEKHQVLVQSGFYHQYMRNMLHLNLGNGAFSEIGQLAGISNTDWSWAALFADFDNDGWKDLFVTNGYKSDYTNMDFMAYAAAQQVQTQRTGKEVALSDLLAAVPSIEVSNYGFKNNGNLGFEDLTEKWGLKENSLSNGAAYADLDLDGDLDLIVNNVNALASVYENTANDQKNTNYLQLSLEASKANSHAVGAKVIVENENAVWMQELMPTRGFQSSVEPIIHIGLGQDSLINKLQIQWPDGSSELISNPILNQRVRIKQSSNKPFPQKPTTIDPSLKQEEGIISYIHRENGFVDFKREPLLPKMLSTLGPAMAIKDFNNDGKIDVFIGAAKGDIHHIWLQKQDGTFASTTQKNFTASLNKEAVDALAADLDQDGDQDLCVVYGGNEEASAIDIYLNNGKGQFSKGNTIGNEELLLNAGCIVSSDIDQDGDLDLFVGGRVESNNFPQSPQSMILINNGRAEFREQTANWNSQLQYAGMICDAVWQDLNQDSRPDLITIGDWNGVRIWINEGDTLIEETTARIGQRLNGWWNVIHPADLDGDGDLDLVLGNEGKNTQYQLNDSSFAYLFSKDFDNNGSMDPIMVYPFGGTEFPMPARDDLMGQLVMLRKRFPDYHTYAKAGMKDIFTSTELADMDTLFVSEQRTGWLENINGKFQFHPLPLEAQFSPVYAIESVDLNNDGQLDLILGGNFSASRVQFGRSDANWGQIFLGDGEGQFHIQDQQSTGLRIQGDVRKMKIADNRLFIAINNGPLSVYRLADKQIP